MNKTVIVDGIGKVVLTDKSYLASGGEGDIHVKDDMAFKIYHDVKQMVPKNKITDLQKITTPNVIVPKHMLYDEKGVLIGYSMDFIKNTHYLCKLFTKSFKQKNNISDECVFDLVLKIKETLEEIHRAGFLVVDLNELNILVGKKFTMPYFIDTDSYGSINGTWRATAIMESIRDPLVKNNQWTENSDWFSFGIIAFNLLTHIHPYKGTHPDYKPNEWLLRMKNGASIFDKGVMLPSVVNDFNKIDPAYLSWFKDIFLSGKRLPPPPIGDVAGLIAVPTTFTIMSSSAAFLTDLIVECPDTILNIFHFMGVPYYICSDKIYKNKLVMPIDVNGYDQVLVCESSGINMVVAKRKDNHVTFETEKAIPVGTITANGMMYRNGCIYTVANQKLIENSFTQIGDKVLHGAKQVGNVLDLATKVYDGVIFQDLLGKIHITLPYEKGKCKIMHIAELDGYRILDARGERNVVAVMTEKGGLYHRFVFSFSADYTGYKVRVSNDVQYADINLTVLPNGVGALATDTEVEIFKDESVKVVANPPFNSNTKLFNVSGGVCYVDGKLVYSAKMKK